MKKIILASLFFVSFSSFAGTGEILCSTSNRDEMSAISELNQLQLSTPTNKFTAISSVTFVTTVWGIKACVSVVKE